MQIFANLVSTAYFETGCSKKGGFLPFLDCSVDAVVPQEISKEIRGAPWLNGRLSFVERRGGTSLT